MRQRHFTLGVGIALGIVLVLQIIEPGTQIDLGQQRGTGFVDLLEGLVANGFGLQQLRVFDLGLLVDVEQVFGMGTGTDAQQHHD